MDKAGGSQEVQVQSLTEPNYLLQMQTLIDQGATEKESLERIQKLKQILDLMESKHKPYQPNPTATKTDVTEEENKTKEELDKTENRLCDDKTGTRKQTKCEHRKERYDTKGQYTRQGFKFTKWHKNPRYHSPTT